MLNNRLAVYIDTVRRLEQDNRELRVSDLLQPKKKRQNISCFKSVIATYTDTYQTEASKVKQLYERELEDAKALIEELARDKTRLQIESEKADADAQDALAKYRSKTFPTSHCLTSLNLDLLERNVTSALLKLV